jgi:hypothetical protein
MGKWTGEAVCQSSTLDRDWPEPTITSRALGSRVSVSLLDSPESSSPAPPPKRNCLTKAGPLFQKSKL